jgi:hypothetical protein
MPVKQKRLIISTALWVTRTVGWILIGLVILSVPQMRFLTGRLAVGFGLLSSLVLGLVGIVVLVGMKSFLLFFDRYLSRN